MKKKLVSKLPELIDIYNLNLSRGGGGERLTQRGLSRLTGVAVSTINRLYKNKFTQINSDVIEKLCEFFNCELQDLLALREIEQKSSSKAK